MEANKDQNNENNSINTSDPSESYNNADRHGIPQDEKRVSIPPFPLPRSVASVASAAYAKNGNGNAIAEDEAKLNNKVREVGLPAIPCIFCRYKDPIEFDLVIHYLERHKPDLFKLPIGKGSMEFRAEYAIELAKRSLAQEEAADEDEDRESGED